MAQDLTFNRLLWIVEGVEQRELSADNGASIVKAKLQHRGSDTN